MTESRTWTCGKKPSAGSTTFGCGVEYERPPRKERSRRRHTRINECRTTTCPECGHIDALYGPLKKVHNSQEPGQITWRVVCQTKEEVSLSGPGPCRGMKTVTRAEFEEFWKEAE